MHNAVVPFHPAGARRAARRSAGFTLVEVLIVVVILGILAALAVPRMGRTDTTRLRSASAMLVADLEFAQVESMAHGNAPRAVVFDNAGGHYHLALSSSPDTPIVHPVDRAPYRVEYGTRSALQLEGVTVSSFSLNGDNMVGFGVYGQLDQTTPATITLAAGDRSVTITLDAITGEPTIGAVN